MNHLKKSTLKFHRSLWKYTNNIKEICVEADSYIELVKAAINQFPKLYKIFRKITKTNPTELVIIGNGKCIALENLTLAVHTKDNILVPLIGGTGRAGSILAAIALVAIVVATGQLEFLVAVQGLPGAAAVSASTAISSGAAVVGVSISTIGQIGLGIAASLFLSALSPAPRINNRVPNSTGGIRTENDAFGSLVNTTDTRTPVFLNYGMTRVSGQLLSGFIKVIDHGKNDIIKVGDQF